MQFLRGVCKESKIYPISSMALNAKFDTDIWLEIFFLQAARLYPQIYDSSSPPAKLASSLSNATGILFASGKQTFNLYETPKSPRTMTLETQRMSPRKMAQGTGIGQLNMSRLGMMSQRQEGLPNPGRLGLIPENIALAGKFNVKRISSHLNLSISGKGSRSSSS